MWSPASSVADADGSISAHSNGSEDGPEAFDVHRLPLLSRETAASYPHVEHGVSELKATQKDADTINLRGHSPSGLRSWRFTPSPPQEEHRLGRTGRGSTPLVIATPQIITRLQRRAAAEVDTRWRAAGPVSPVPMRPRARLETVTVSESRIARHSGRDPRSSNTSRDHSTRLSTDPADTAGRDDDNNEEWSRRNARTQFDRLTPENRFGSEQQDHPPDTSSHDAHRRQATHDSEADVLEPVHERRQFGQVWSSVRRPHTNGTPTQDASHDRIHDHKGGDYAFGKRRSRRRAQESRESADGSARRRSRHWSEVPQWRP